MTEQERLAELRRIAEAATDAIERALFNNNPDAVRSAERGLHVLLDTLATQAAEIERLRRERDAALDVLGREDIGDGAKVEGVRLILKGGDRGWPTRESERARLVGEVGGGCRGADPLCAAGCLVEAALKQRLVDKEGTV